MRHLRIVSLYRRDYNPTASFRDADLASLDFGTMEGQEDFLRSQAVDIATFLVTFAREQCIPPAQLEGASGGIALIGWSLGSLHTHAVVAYLDALPSTILSDLGKYLHTMVSHGGPTPTFIMFGMLNCAVRRCGCGKHWYTQSLNLQHRTMV